MLKCAVQVMRWRDTRAHRPAICTRNRCTHYVQFNEQPLLAEASTILKSITHLRTFSANGIYVTLQLFLSIYDIQWSKIGLNLNDGKYSTMINQQFNVAITNDYIDTTMLSIYTAKYNS